MQNNDIGSLGTKLVGVRKLQMSGYWDGLQIIFLPRVFAPSARHIYPEGSNHSIVMAKKLQPPVRHERMLMLYTGSINVVTPIKQPHCVEALD